MAQTDLIDAIDVVEERERLRIFFWFSKPVDEHHGFFVTLEGPGRVSGDRNIEWRGVLEDWIESNRPSGSLRRRVGRILDALLSRVGGWHGSLTASQVVNIIHTALPVRRLVRRTGGRWPRDEALTL